MNLTLGKKIFLGFGVLTAALLAVATVGYVGIKGGSDAVNEIGGNRLPSVESLLTIRKAMVAVQAAERGLLMVKFDEELRRTVWPRLERNFTEAAAARRVYEALPADAEETAMWRRFGPAWDKWKSDHEAVVEIAHQVDRLVASGTAPTDPTVLALQFRAYDASVEAKASFKIAEDILIEVNDLNVRLAEKANTEADAA